MRLITTDTCEVLRYHENITLYCFASNITRLMLSASQLKESDLGGFWSRRRGWRWPFSLSSDTTSDTHLLLFLTPPPITSVLWALRMRRIWRWRWRSLFMSSPRPTQTVMRDCWLWLVGSLFYFGASSSDFYKRHSRVSVRVGFLVFAVRGGDASPSGAGTSCGFVFLGAAGAGQQCSTQRHADRNTESRPR